MLSPKGIQDYQGVQKHYDQLMAASHAAEIAPHFPKIDVNREIGSDLESLESPSGKGPSNA